MAPRANGPEQKQEVLECPVGKDWIPHRREATVAMAQIGVMAETMTDVRDATQHLTTLKDIKELLAHIRDSLVGPAVGRRQVSLVAHIMMLVVLGTIIILVLIANTNKTVEITPTGIKISSQQTQHDGLEQPRDN